MKKLLAIILALSLVFCFAACKDKGEEDGKNSAVADKSSEVAAAVSSGKIPEMRLSLGTKKADLQDCYDKLEQEMNEQHTDEGHVHSHDDIILSISEGNLSVTYEIGDEAYYYEKEKAENGVAVVCTFSDAFGFKQGTVKSEVESALASLELRSLTAGEDELYFVPLSEAIILRYKEGGRQLDFYFNNNELVATVLRDTANWTI